MALEAGADVLLMPANVDSAIATIERAVGSGRLTTDRIDQSVRRVLIAKAHAGLPRGRLVDLSEVDRIVNVPENAMIAATVAERSITLARDDMGLVPLPQSDQRRVLSVTYAEPADLIAGRAFDAALARVLPHLQTSRADTRTSPAEYLAMRLRADSADLVIVSAYVSPTPFRGSIAAAASFSAMVDSLAAAKKPVVVISFGSPYLLSAFPSVSSYVLAWGGAPVSQRAAAKALLGDAKISGRLPISIPPALKFGAGIDRQPHNPILK